MTPEEEQKNEIESHIEHRMILDKFSVFITKEPLYVVNKSLENQGFHIGTAFWLNEGKPKKAWLISWGVDPKLREKFLRHRRVTKAWPLLRIFFLGTCDENCLIKQLPAEVILIIVEYVTG